MNIMAWNCRGLSAPDSSLALLAGRNVSTDFFVLARNEDYSFLCS